MNILKRLGLDGFVILLFTCIFLAWLEPSVGADRDSFSPGDAASWGVSFIFFFYGLKLSREKLKNGLVNVKLHMTVHLSTFVMFPLIVLAAMKIAESFGFGLAAEGNMHYLWLGAFFLASLPSTVSSSVVMVSMARGNIPAAIFDASVSSLMGVFLTPIWMSMFLGSVDGSNGLGDVLVKLVIQVIVPVCAGVLLNPKFGHIARAHNTMLRMFDQTVILMIVYTSFCDSFQKKMFDGFPFSDIVILSVLLVGLFFTAYFTIYGVCKLLKFNTEDTITALFCGSKKSLVHGSVMSKVLFANPAIIGVVLLPTMLYHAYQLIIVSIIARKFGERPEIAE